MTLNKLICPLRENDFLECFRIKHVKMTFNSIRISVTNFSEGFHYGVYENTNAKLDIGQVLHSVTNVLIKYRH